MLSDARHPLLTTPPTTEIRHLRGVSRRSTCWSPGALAELLVRLERGAEALSRLAPERRLAAWEGVVGELREAMPADLDRALKGLCGLSGPGLEAGLETMLDGVRGEVAAALFARARSEARTFDGPLVVFLASNVPGLAVQPLLPALAVGRPVLIKSPSSEPLLAPYLVERLARREPALGNALAAVTWRGGDRRLEEPVLAAAGKVLAYGDEATLRDLRERTAGGVPFVGFGPMLSLAVLSADVAPGDVAPGLARDIALFDQRGCLSVQAVYTAGDPAALARELGAALRRQAERWPMGGIATGDAAAVRQVREEAAMRGLDVAELPLRSGTVVVEPEPALQPSPGLRTVRIHALADLADLAAILRPWSGRIQGAALAGTAALSLAPELRRLGVTRLASPGELQAADARWANGGLPPLAAVV